MATKYHIIKHRAFFKTLTAHITHSYWADSYRDSSALCPVRVIKNRRQINMQFLHIFY